jgi:HK97 family phage major capsid protein
MPLIDQSTRDDQKACAIPLHIDRLAGNSETLDLPISFASERIIDDAWAGPLRLSLDPAHVDLSQAKERGIPVRVMHERGLPPARVVDVRIDGDKLRGTMRFSQSVRGRDLYRDAVDGILTDTSVGAVIYDVREESDHLVATRWRPREVSLVDEGADQSVGVNRAATAFNIAAPAAPCREETTMPAENLEQIAETQRSAAATASERPREEINIRELATYAHKRAPELGIDRMADDAVAFGRPFDEFRAQVWKLLSDRQAQQPAAASPSELGLSEGESREFSIVRAARAYLTRDWKGAAFELECSRAVADRLGREAKGFFVPLEVQRTMTAGSAAAGGYLVGTEHRADMFIEALRAMAVAFRAGVRTLPGLVGNVSIPKQTSSATFAWITEGADVTLTDLALGAVTLTPRTISGGVPMTRKLLQQSSPAVEMLVREDLIRGAALAIDDAVFEGSGAAGQPLGIANHGDINTVAVSSDGTPTWAEVVGFESAVAADDALGGSLAYVTTPTVRGNMKVTSKDTGSGLFVASGNETNGYPILTSTQLTANALLFGDWSQIIVGFWGVLDVKPDEATLAASGGLILRAFQDCDVAIRHAQAFAKGT